MTFDYLKSMFSFIILCAMTLPLSNGQPMFSSEPDDQLKQEFELLKTFLAKNKLSSKTSSTKHMNSKFDSSIGRYHSRGLGLTSRSLVNDTIQMLYNGLINFGFSSVGISESCRELAICNTSNFILTQMPAFVQAYGREQLMNLPTSVFGNHNFTNAWLVGLSSAESSFCNALFACENPADKPKLTSDLGPSKPMTKLTIDMMHPTYNSYYLQGPVNGANNNSIPFMLLIQLVPNNNTNS